MTFMALALVMTLVAPAQAQDPETIGPNGKKDVTSDDVAAALADLEEPMYTPFIELYLLEESKALRKEMQNTRAELIERWLIRSCR